MALAYSKPSQLGAAAPDFSLPGVDGKTYRLYDCVRSKAVLVIFMCNHCPYVKAVRDRINDLAAKYIRQGVAVFAINSNDAIKYPDDSFKAMRETSDEFGFVFPYLYDESQQVAQAFDAVCTPEFYAYKGGGDKLTLAYHGRLDDNWKDHKAVTKQDLAEALDAILAGKQPSREQTASMGCSIKWK
jgi:peroxiredoxin